LYRELSGLVPGIGDLGEAAPFGRKFLYGLWPSIGVNGVVQEELGIGDWGLGAVAAFGRRFFDLAFGAHYS